MRIVTKIHHLRRGDIIAVIDAKGLAERGLGAGDLKEVFQYDIEHQTAVVWDRSGVDDDGEREEGRHPMLSVRFEKKRPGKVDVDFVMERWNGFWLVSGFHSEVKYILLLSRAKDPDLSIIQAMDLLPSEYDSEYDQDT